MQNDYRVSLALPKELYDEAKAAADAYDRSLSSVVRVAIREWLSKHKAAPKTKPA